MLPARPAEPGGVWRTESPRCSCWQQNFPDCWQWRKDWVLHEGELAQVEMASDKTLRRLLPWERTARPPEAGGQRLRPHGRLAQKGEPLAWGS